MASTSGRAQGNTISYSNFYFTDWQLVGQSVDGNYSVINWQTYWHFVNNDRQLDSGNTVINGGAVWSNGGRIYNYAGNFSTRDMLLASGQTVIGHNGDGTKVFNINGTTLGYDSERSSTSVNWELPQINRYININGWNLSNVTEKSMVVNVSTSGTAAAVDYSLNGGGWTRGYTGNFTSNSFTINNLVPGTTYSVRIRVQNASGGLWTESGVNSATTIAFVISTLSVPTKTDTTATLQAVTNYVADQLQYRVQGGSTWTTVSGSFTNTSTLISGLTSNATFTYEARARHQDSQSYSAVKTVTFATGLPQPLQATQLVPGNGNAVGSLLPLLDWQYNATSPDAQSAYQIILQRASDAVTLWDSGKVTSSTTQAPVPGTVTLAYNVPYQWQVKTWSGSGIAGVYSDLTTFRISQAPVATITAPTDGTTISTDIPTIVWTYSDPEGTPQTSYRIIISESGVGVYDRKVTNSAATSFEVPLHLLENNHTYTFEVEVTDSDGIAGRSAAVDVTISFIAPPVPTIDVETSTNDLFNLINVGTTKPETESFDTDEIKVWKREVGAAEWNYLTTVAATPQYISQFQDTDTWTKSGVADVITNHDFSRQGGFAQSVSTTGAGSAKITRTLNLGTIIQNKRQRVWVHLSNNPPIQQVVFRFGTDSSNYFKYNIFYNYPALTVSNVWTTSNSMTTAAVHNMLSGHKVQFTTTGTLPAPLQLVTDYFIRFLTTSTFSIHRSADDALNNVNAIDLTTAGTGTLTVTPQPIIINNAWNAVEMDNRAFAAIGSPSLDNIQWQQVEIVATGAVPVGDVIFDNWHIVPSKDSMYVYDYELANGKTYEYSASSVNKEQLLESGRSAATDAIIIKYKPFENTYVIPVDAPSSSVVAFMDLNDTPTWTTHTDTEYYTPIGAKYPVVYSNGVQKFRRGKLTLQFFDKCFKGAGIDGLRAFEAIMNEKPLMIRTYWGEIYYVSIDGDLSVDRMKNVGWSAGFGFTELQDEPK